MNGTMIEYELMTEAFLKQLCALYPDERIEEGKELIEYFIQNYSEDGVLHTIFSKGLADEHFGDDLERDKEIMVDSAFCFKKDKIPEKAFMSLELLWKIVSE